MACTVVCVGAKAPYTIAAMRKSKAAASSRLLPPQLTTYETQSFLWVVSGALSLTGNRKN